MLRSTDYQMVLWLSRVLAVVAVARGFWLYRASLTWPTADGAITHSMFNGRRELTAKWALFFGATFTYEFLDNVRPLPPIDPISVRGKSSRHFWSEVE